MNRVMLLPIGLALASAAPVAAPSGTTVLELFTSQGCSSCPPADRLLVEVADRPGVIVISRPVTYWDALGWKDTLAREENTRLQRAYQQRFKTRSVYTPQLVADGSREWVGSNRGRLAAELRQRSDSVRVTVDQRGDGAVVTFAGPPRGDAEVKLLSLHGERSVAIGRGENGGRTVRYTNVVASEAVVGRWTGGTGQVRLDPAKLARLPGDRLAVIVQSPAAGPILGAALVVR
jgi:hypothetical protein